MRVFDGSRASPAEVLDELRSPGLLAPYKLVIVEDADQLVKDNARALFERYAQSPSQDATLVLRAETWRPGKLDKLVAAVGSVVKCDQITVPQAINWAVGRSGKRYAAELGRDAAELLVERVGTDLVRLDAELAKLAASAGVGADAVIDRELVAELVAPTREQAVWSIQEDLLSGDPGRAIGRVREALDVSRHPAVLVSYAMMDLASKLHAMSRGLESGEPAQALSKRLKLWGPSGRLIEQTARRTPPERAGELLDLCVEGDAACKSGRGEPDRVLERLALRFGSV